MFFIISKLLFFLISPIVWVISFLFLSLFSKKPKRKKRYLITSIVLLLFFTNSFIMNTFMRGWEVEATKIEDVGNYDYGILLGGMMTYDGKYERIGFHRSVDRLMQTIELYKTKHIKKIFIAGGSGSIIDKNMIEANYLKNYLVRIGIPEKDILTEYKSRNTHENAVYTKEALGDKVDNSTFLLISSSCHLRRAQKCYSKVGIETTVYATDRYAGPNKWAFDYYFVPEVDTLTQWKILIKEYVGYVAYWFANYI